MDVDPKFPAPVSLQLVEALEKWFPPEYLTEQKSPEYMLRLAGKGELIQFLRAIWMNQNNIEPE